MNRLIARGGFDLILSIGQVTPHEVIGGREGINRSHYLGAVYGMERIMGRVENPVRNVLNYASDHFLRHLPIVYVLTVVGRMADAQLALRGLFVGDDVECFYRAADLSLRVNFETLDMPIRRPWFISIRLSFTAHGWATRLSTVHPWHWPAVRSWSSLRRA